jgi:hypothetical protein
MRAYHYFLIGELVVLADVDYGRIATFMSGMRYLATNM